MTHRTFRQWALSRLVDGAYKKMPLGKKIHFWLESWCSYQYGREIMQHQNNRRKSPSGLEWETYSVPWYAKYISRMEFQVRNLVFKKTNNIRGFFPFYYRNNN